MTTFNEVHKDILDDISRQINRPGSNVTVSISIDGGGAGVIKFESLLTPQTMTRVTDFINELEADQQTDAD